MVDKALSANHITPATRFLPSGYNTPLLRTFVRLCAYVRNDVSVHSAVRLQSQK